jgi:ABC-type glycerol-3-phosphate transport system substrate-binding protein
MLWRMCLVALVAALLGSGCGRAATRAAGGGDGESLRLEFWHTRRGDQEKLLQEICREYSEQTPGVTIDPIYQGGYDELNKKLRASIQGGALPALAVAYESQLSEYMANDAVRPLDDLVADPEIGFTPDELADFPPQYLESNRFQQFGNQLLSFPFTKSNLVLYYNRAALEREGLRAPPETWEEFERVCASVTRRTGKPALAFAIDASTLDGMVYSYGGEVLAEDGVTTLFDQAPTVRAFEMIQRMARQKTLSEDAGDDTGALFAGEMRAFALSTSSSRAMVDELVGGRFPWSIAMIPHAAGVAPATVMYGPNVCLFRGSERQEREAWRFVRYFVSPEVTARWSRQTGYLPVRRTAAALPEMEAFFRETEAARNTYEILPMARPEPNVVGWQEVRKHLEDAARAVIAGRVEPAQAAAELKRRADRTLAESR